MKIPNIFAKNLIFWSPRCNSTASCTGRLSSWVLCRFSKGRLRMLLIRVNHQKGLSLPWKERSQNNTGYTFLFFLFSCGKNAFSFLFSLKQINTYLNIPHADPHIAIFPFFLSIIKWKENYNFVVSSIKLQESKPKSEWNGISVSCEKLLRTNWSMIFNRIFGCLVESALRANAIKTIFENKTPSSQPAVSAMLYFWGFVLQKYWF